jgi:hypothetical protein
MDPFAAGAVGAATFLVTWLGVPRLLPGAAFGRRATRERVSSGDLLGMAERQERKLVELRQANDELRQLMDKRISMACQRWMESLESEILQASQWREKLEKGNAAEMELLRREVNNIAVDQAEWQKSFVDRIAEEQQELEVTFKTGIETPLQEMRQLNEAMQQQVASITESLQSMQPWANDISARVEGQGKAVIDVAQALQGLEDKIDVIEAVVGQLPPRQPATPMGPVPPGAGGLPPDVADLLRQSQQVRAAFAQRVASRGATPAPAAPSVRTPL